MMEIFFKPDYFKKRLCLEDISSSLITNFIGSRLIYKFCIDSTNDVAKRYLNDGLAKNGDVFLSDKQTSGRGRMKSRVWESGEMENICLSLLISNSSFCSPILTLIVGVVVMNVLRKVTCLDVKMKWPNDIYINDKKISGILCENLSFGNYDNLIIGIGININSYNFSDRLKNSATSLYLEKGRYFSREKIISEILNKLELYLCENGPGIEDLIKKYKSSCISINRKVIFYDEGEVPKYGKIIDISNTGELMIMTHNNDIINLNSSYKLKYLES